MIMNAFIITVFTIVNILLFIGSIWFDSSLLRWIAIRILSGTFYHI